MHYGAWIVVGLLCLTGIAGAMSSTHYDISWSVIGGGGGDTGTTTYKVQGTFGQIAGLSTSSLFSINGGFWPGIGTSATPVPAASFTLSPNPAQSGQTVQFTDTSTGSPTGWEWNFGDGSTDTANKNPKHVYTTPNGYTVTMRARNTAGWSAWTSRTLTVTTVPLPPLIDKKFKASIKVSPKKLYVNQPVTFTAYKPRAAKGKVVTMYYWDFNGDNVIDSNQPLAQWIYTTARKYSVRLWVGDGTSVGKPVKKTITVKVPK